MWGNIKDNYNKLVYSGNYKIDSISKDKMILKTGEKNSDNNISTINILDDNNVELSMASYEIKERDIVRTARK